jgi:hypothetical protein
VFLFRELIIIFATPEYSGDATFHHYSKFTRHPVLRHYFVTTNIPGYLVNLFSSAMDISSPVQWNYFLQFSGIILFGLVDLFSSA